MPTEMELLIESLRTPKVGGSEASWSEVKEEWRQAIARLFEQLRAWLKPALDEGLLQQFEQPLTLNEEPLGQYESSVLQFGAPSGRVVSIVPHRRLVLDALGRVDITTGAHKWIVLRKAPEHWVIVVSRQPGKEEDLTEDSLARILRSVIG